MIAVLVCSRANSYDAQHPDDPPSIGTPTRVWKSTAAATAINNGAVVMILAMKTPHALSPADLLLLVVV
jgi:hypothetical protein